MGQLTHLNGIQEAPRSQVEYFQAVEAGVGDVEPLARAVQQDVGQPFCG